MRDIIKSMIKWNCYDSYTLEGTISDFRITYSIDMYSYVKK